MDKLFNVFLKDTFGSIENLFYQVYTRRYELKKVVLADDTIIHFKNKDYVYFHHENKYVHFLKFLYRMDMPSIYRQSTLDVTKKFISFLNEKSTLDGTFDTLEKTNNFVHLIYYELGTPISFNVPLQAIDVRTSEEELAIEIED